MSKRLTIIIDIIGPSVPTLTAAFQMLDSIDFGGFGSLQYLGEIPRGLTGTELRILSLNELSPEEVVAQPYGFTVSTAPRVDHSALAKLETEFGAIHGSRPIWIGFTGTLSMWLKLAEGRARERIFRLSIPRGNQPPVFYPLMWLNVMLRVPGLSERTIRFAFSLEPFAWTCCASTPTILDGECVRRNWQDLVATWASLKRTHTNVNCDLSAVEFRKELAQIGVHLSEIF